MRHLAVDVGDKRIGVALSDPMGMVATPLEVYNCIGAKKDVQYIAALANKHQVGTVVVGLPKNMNGTEGERAKLCRQFADKLARRTNAEIVMHDERLTTVGAESVLISADVSRKKRKKVIDKLAAQLILQNYLDFKNR